MGHSGDSQDSNMSDDQRASDNDNMDNDDETTRDDTLPGYTSKAATLRLDGHGGHAAGMEGWGDDTDLDATTPAT